MSGSQYPRAVCKANESCDDYMKTDLEWGETVWDDMTREELLREVQRMYTVLNSMYGHLKMHAEFEGPDQPFWGLEGVGGSHLEMCRQILEPIGEQSHVMYRTFFRYARDLLFEQTGYKFIGTGWAICSKCGTMIGNLGRIGQPCEYGDKDCDGVFRKLEWSDLQPKTAEPGTNSK